MSGVTDPFIDGRQEVHKGSKPLLSRNEKRNIHELMETHQ